jgi:ATP-dependent DNA helicase RecG
VSAFANTSGGHVVFGAEEANKKFEVVGVIDGDKVQNEFLGGLRSPFTISYAVDVKESFVDGEGRTIRVFLIPATPGQDRPVHLRRNLGVSSIL